MEQKNKSVEELMLDSEVPRYELVKLVSLRFNQIKKNSENSKSTVSQLIEKSMSDIVSGEVSKEEIQKQAVQPEIPEKLPEEQEAKPETKEKKKNKK